ncbi:RecQ family ATP-dependent DNA helicase [Desulfofalx alkaliphila]|uniref:RecQ family ATP-dependent DNA helicase n=1 Tax=Desulfofalx alkaliphila TaxID=105483 RepID=UPI001EE4D6BB|nr:RecQ family ATP-dependent DNA helicase [Desulfofalx alkaliphila]
MSQYLQDILGAIHIDKEFNKRVRLIHDKPPKWISTIKGDEQENDYPAKEFFEKYLPIHLGEFAFVQNLIIPEVEINEICQVFNKRFMNQQVDFYLPQAKLVIEIDGQFHKLDDTTRIRDRERDSYLLKHGIKTIRIDTFELYNKRPAYYKKVEKILKRIKEYSSVFEEYRQSLGLLKSDSLDKYTEKVLLSTAIIRFQLTLLSLLEKGRISLEDREWKFNILAHDIDGFASHAIEDLMLWLENLCKLTALKLMKPQYKINYIKAAQQFDFSKGYINIDFSLLKRWTDENKLSPNVIYVRTDYFDDFEYFRVSTSDPVKYSIIDDGENSNKEALEFFLKNIYGFDSFNDGQFQIISHALALQDTIGLLPTGGGKSLCYQLMALLQPCVSFVVCPIKSLMYDQKDNLDKAFITNTNYISSDQTPAEKEKVRQFFSEGRYQFIWISPERFQDKKFRKELDALNKNLTIAYAVIDEVHCLSEWGHDFRTSYLNLIRTIRRYCPSSVFVGLTATASNFVLEDIKVEFEVETANIKTLTSFGRPELEFHVIKDESDKRKALIDLLEELKIGQPDIFIPKDDYTKSGIIFTLTVNGPSGCYDIANDLKRELKVDVRWYSGKIPKIKQKFIMNNSDFNIYKQVVQKDFKENKIPLLVATKAFGMGIDKKNVRYTVHFGIPRSIESLYQEAGRAGRDKKRANCYIIFSPAKINANKLNKLFDVNTSFEEIKEIQKDVRYEGKDVMVNFFLWLQNTKGEEFELGIMEKIFRCAEPKRIKKIYCRRLGHPMADVQKGIYRLRTVGVVEDWTIEDWNTEVIEVEFADFNEETTLNALLKYINKYDKEFSLSAHSIKNPRYSEYIKIFRDNKKRLSERIFTILLKWSYENIIYNRRQSLKNIYDLCNNFKNAHEFKERIESFFKFNENTFILDHIANSPADYEKWFDVFYTESEEYKEFVGIEKVKELYDTMTRFLESYRYNTGLNYLSGIVALFLNDFDKRDNRERFISSLDQIVSYSDATRQNILNNTLSLCTNLDDKNKEYLSEILCGYYPDKGLEIYEALGDMHSLYVNLSNEIERIKHIRAGLIWRI